MNYTEATSTCAGHRGYLAHILNDARTNFLSTLIQQQILDVNKIAIVTESTPTESADGNAIDSVKVPIRHAFIGLKEFNRKGNFIDSFDIPMKCFRFRAWAPKYPSGETRLGCVAITASRSWKMFDCRKHMPFICELGPSKPKRINRRKFNRRCSLKRSNN